jgi:hypothetical protein
VEQLTDKLYLVLMYELNGLLYMLYWVVGHLPLLGALVCALVVMLVHDRQGQELAYAQSGRWGRVGVTVEGMAQRRMQLYTAFIFVLYLAGMMIFPEPVPFLGLAMWGSTALALWMLPSEREPLLFRCNLHLRGHVRLLVCRPLRSHQLRGAEAVDQPGEPLLQQEGDGGLDQGLQGPGDGLGGTPTNPWAGSVQALR